MDQVCSSKQSEVLNFGFDLASVALLKPKTSQILTCAFLLVSDSMDVKHGQQKIIANSASQPCLYNLFTQTIISCVDFKRSSFFVQFNTEFFSRAVNVKHG